jgi:hypothetical protein
MERRSASEWEALVQEWRASGLSRRAFAAWRRVHPQTLSWWAWRLGGGNRVAVRPAFVEVVVSEPPSAPALVVEVGQVRVHVPRGFDAGEVRRLVAALC